MEVSIYRQEVSAESVSLLAPGEELIVQSAVEFHKKSAELAEAAGLDQQAKIHRWEARNEAAKLLPLPPFPEVSDAEYNLWQQFLPMCYAGAALRDYGYDLVPPDVLQVMGEHRDTFDSFEIRTPEIRKTDPALFGVRRVGKKVKRYLVARWAESRLVTSAEIKNVFLEKLTARRKRCTVWLGISIPTILFSVFDIAILKGGPGFAVILLFMCVVASMSFLCLKEAGDEARELVSLPLKA